MKIFATPTKKHVQKQIFGGTIFPDAPVNGELFFLDKDNKNGLFIFINGWRKVITTEEIILPLNSEFPQTASPGNLFIQTAEDETDGLYFFVDDWRQVLEVDTHLDDSEDVHTQYALKTFLAENYPTKKETSSPIKFNIVQVNQKTPSQSQDTISSLTVDVQGGRTYRYEAYIKFMSSRIDNGINFGYELPPKSTAVLEVVSQVQEGTKTDIVVGHIGSIITRGVPAQNTEYGVIVRGTITPSQDGKLQLKFASTSYEPGSIITIKAGSQSQLQLIA